MGHLSCMIKKGETGSWKHLSRSKVVGILSDGVLEAQSVKMYYSGKKALLTIKSDNPSRTLENV